MVENIDSVDYSFRNFACLLKLIVQVVYHNIFVLIKLPSIFYERIGTTVQEI